MLLAINANNTNVKFGLFDGDRMVGDWRLRTDSGRTADEYLVWLGQLLALAGIDRQPDQRVPSSPRWCRRRCSICACCASSISAPSR